MHALLDAARRAGPVLALVIAPLPAQQLYFAGSFLHAYANGFTRGLAGQGAGELMQRFDADDVRAFGIEPAHPGVQVIRGVAFQARDFGGSVPDALVDVTIYTEDPARPNFPDLANPLGSALDVATSAGLFQNTFAYFAQPVLAPVGADVFVGIRINATTSQVGGVRLNTLTSSTTAAAYDLAGAGMPASPPEANSYRLFRDLTDQLTYHSRGQFMVELLTTTPSGFATTLSQQAGYTGGAVPPGATTFLSGLHPDAASPPLHAGRADDVGFVFDDPTVPAQPVAFVASFQGFGPVVPLDALVPGSIGGLCIDPAQLVPLAVVVSSPSGRAWHLTTIAPTARPALAGLAWVQQAIALDLWTGTLRGTQCAQQHF